MALFPPSGVLRGFPAAAYTQYASPQTLVRPCSTKKLLISEVVTFNKRGSIPKDVAIFSGFKGSRSQGFK
jgi:hypothetical protein